jgi:hypothetical protein
MRTFCHECWKKEHVRQEHIRRYGFYDPSINRHRGHKKPIPTEKECPMCHEVKPIAEFNLYPSSKRPYTYCKKCQTKKAHESRACNILQHHHDELKEDPEHLKTDFMISIINRGTKGP